MDPIVEEIYSGVDIHLLETNAAYRREACRNNPLLFAVCYLPDTIKDADSGEMSFSYVHAEWAEIAKLWARPGPRKSRENRHAFVAPRKTGKTSWWYLILPMWWAAYGYSKFTVAYADSARQAENHLKTFRKELDSNDRLREDFPDLCTPSKRRSGMSDGDSASSRSCANGFIFMAQGLDSNSLGNKRGNDRPDTIIIDDAEPDAANYSLYQKAQRLHTIQNSVLYQDWKADVVWTGTVTMHGSCVHDMVRYARGEEAAELEWVAEDKWQVHHYKPIFQDESGQEVSFWPTAFPLEELNEIRDTPAYRLNMENDPMGAAGLLWSPGDIKYADFPCDAGTYISIDPIVSKANLKSDLTGVAVVGCAIDPVTRQRKALVKLATGVRLTGKDLKLYVEAIMESFPEASRLIVETNQGGVLFEELFEDLPITVIPYKSTEKKETRAGRLQALYQNRPEPLVFHTEKFHQAETEMFTYPNMGDDIVDAIGGAVLRWVKPVKRIRAKMGVIHPS